MDDLNPTIRRGGKAWLSAYLGRWILVATVAVIGCNDPKYKAKQAMRDESIAEYLGAFERLERRRPEQIQLVFDVEKGLASEREVSLDGTLRLWQEQERRHSVLLHEDVSMEYNYVLRRAVKGDVDVIPDVVARMFY